MCFIVLYLKQQEPCILPPHYPLRRSFSDLFSLEQPVSGLPACLQAAITTADLVNNRLQLVHGMAHKYLILLWRMSFSDRRIWLKLFTLVFLVMLHRLPLSSWSSIQWIFLPKLTLVHAQDKSFDRASFPDPSGTGIVEESKCLLVWTEIYPYTSFSCFIHNELIEYTLTIFLVWVYSRCF